MVFAQQRAVHGQGGSRAIAISTRHFHRARHALPRNPLILFSIFVHRPEGDERSSGLPIRSRIAAFRAASLFIPQIRRSKTVVSFPCSLSRKATSCSQSEIECTRRFAMPRRRKRSACFSSIRSSAPSNKSYSIWDSSSTVASFTSNADIFLRHSTHRLSNGTNSGLTDDCGQNAIARLHLFSRRANMTAPKPPMLFPRVMAFSAWSLSISPLTISAMRSAIPSLYQDLFLSITKTTEAVFAF